MELLGGVLLVPLPVPVLLPVLRSFQSRGQRSEQEAT